MLNAPFGINGLIKLLLNIARISFGESDRVLEKNEVFYIYLWSEKFVQSTSTFRFTGASKSCFLDTKQSHSIFDWDPTLKL